jgi:hypothetical protein
MLPAVTALVAHHPRTLVSRALARLERLGDREGFAMPSPPRDAGRLGTWR